jgi:hypothetical protein
MKNVPKICYSLLGRGLLFLLLVYWVSFIGFSVVKLAEDGSGRVAAWYRYISTWVTSVDGPPVAFVIHEWNWWQFLTAQVI